MRTVAIDRDRCNGCGLCVRACHEGVIGMKDGKAHVANPTVCDGIGDCLPACPQNAITFMDTDVPAGIIAEQGAQWPIQMQLVNPKMPVFSKGVLNIAADCTAFVVDDFKDRFINGNPIVIGCPKLDPRERFDKISTIIAENDIRVINVYRMHVPCCSMTVGIINEIVSESGKDIKVNVTVFDAKGEIVSRSSCDP